MLSDDRRRTGSDGSQFVVAGWEAGRLWAEKRREGGLHMPQDPRSSWLLWGGGKESFVLFTVPADRLAPQTGAYPLQTIRVCLRQHLFLSSFP